MADVIITPAQFKLGAGKQKIFRAAIADLAIDAGEQAVFDSALNRWLLGDADSQASAKIGGMALATVDSGQPFDVVQEGEVDCGAAAGIVEGVAYFLSPTGGKFVPAGDALLVSGKWYTFIGFGLANNRLQYQPLVGNVQIP